MITCVCVTYGRQKLLERAIAAFLSQLYPCCGVELLVLNTLHRQKLQGDFPFVRIVNLDKRPPSLGDARNMAVEMAKGDRILIFDDDDVALPNLVRTFADNWGAEDNWVWLDKRLCAHGTTIVEIGQGCHGGCFGFTKKAWQEVGGYPSMTVGEDRVLVNKITKLPGYKVCLGDSTPPFICCWANGAFHVSGGGDDKPGIPGAYERAAAALARRIGTGEEKTGKITLNPKMDVDWMAFAEAFMKAELKKNSMNSDVCVIELGRYGDICNVLPVLQHIHNNYSTPTLMVSREFADILDGVSYVNPHVVDLRYDQLDKAIRLAHKEYPHVLCAQIWGENHFHDRECASYNMDSWKACGFLQRFEDRTMLPVFDRRSPEREAALVHKVSADKPLVLVNATHSISSPFPQGPLLLAEIKKQLGWGYNVLDIGGLKLHRIYDLLGLMDSAACLVSVDSAQLHLSAGSKVPVVALVNNDDWKASVLRGNCVARYKYDYAAKNPQDVMTSIRYAVEKSVPVKLPEIVVKSPERKRDILHCVERHPEKNRHEAARKLEAQRTWYTIYDKGVIPCWLDEKDYPRTALNIGDRRALPYLKDVLAVGMLKSAEDDIIFFTNDDNVLHPQLPDMLRYHVSIYDCCCAQRCEFKGSPMPPMNRPPSDFAGAGRSHMGRDLFAFTKRWLKEHWDQIPDFILGASDFDLCLACMIRNHFGITSTRRNLEDIIFPAELPAGYVSHSFHLPFWNRPDNTNTAPSQMHNRRAFKCWSETYAPHLRFDEHLCI